MRLFSTIILSTLLFTFVSGCYKGECPPPFEYRITNIYLHPADTIVPNKTSNTCSIKLYVDSKKIEDDLNRKGYRLISCGRHNVSSKVMNTTVSFDQPVYLVEQDTIVVPPYTNLWDILDTAKLPFFPYGPDPFYSFSFDLNKIYIPNGPYKLTCSWIVEGTKRFNGKQEFASTEGYYFDLY